MIWINGKRISALYIGGKAVKSLYIAGKYVWGAIRGLFATRKWLYGKSWNNNDFWLEK